MNTTCLSCSNNTSKVSITVGVISFIGFLIFGLGQAAYAENDNENVLDNSSYFSSETITTSSGMDIDKIKISGPPQPPPGYELERSAVSLPESNEAMGIKTLSVPAYDWVFGCSAVSGAMIAAYYDRNGYPNMYTGPTSGGVMPMNNSSWPTWSDGYKTYPNLPLAGSKQGVDGRTAKGSINDYWVKYDSTANDPYVGNWTQHAWGTAIGDYMKTSQSYYDNSDGGTTFWNWTSNPAQFKCSNMGSYAGVQSTSGTYGRKLFYEKRGFKVETCYNQQTNNTVSGGFSFTQYMAEIDAGRPVMLNLAGHTVVGIGYDTASNKVYLNDTWDYSTHTMTWGGYYSGMQLLSVSIVNLEAAPAPPPPSSSATLTFLPLLLKPDTVSNGDFESGRVDWTESSTNGYNLIGQWGSPRSGSWYAWLAGADSETSYIQQKVKVPTATPYLVFYYKISSVDACGFDYGYVTINGADVNFTSLCSATDTAGVWYKKSVNLSAYAGQTITLQLRAVTDSLFISSWHIDDVSFQATF